MVPGSRSGRRRVEDVVERVRVVIEVEGLVEMDEDTAVHLVWEGSKTAGKAGGRRTKDLRAGGGQSQRWRTERDEERTLVLRG